MTMLNPKRVSLIAAAIATTIFATGCQEKAATKAPKKAAGPAVDNSPLPDIPGSDDANPDIVGSGDFTVTITPTTQTGPIFNFATGQQVLIKFSISGPSSGSDIDVGLISPVTGGSLSTSNKLSPEFSWNPGSMTQTEFRLVVRNKEKCAKVAASPSQCEFKSGQSITPDTKYDTQSSLYTIKIGASSTTPGTGNNSNMIQQILGMMTGTGTTGGTNSSQLMGILQQMSGGQLSTLLSTLQGTGGSGNLMSILTQIMGGMTLTGEPIDGAVVIDQNAADGLSLTGPGQ